MKSQIAIKQSTISGLILGIFFLIAALLIGSIVYMRSSIETEQAAEQRRTEFKQLGMDLADASDYLTDEARKYAITTDIVHLQRYWEEINNTQTRDKVIIKLKELESPEQELELLAKAKQHSDALVNTERQSMRLVLEALQEPETSMVPEVASYELTQAEKNLGSREKLDKAREIMFDAGYDAHKKEIMEPIARFQEVMNDRLENELEAARGATSNAAVVQIVLALIIICAIALLISTLFKYVTYPVNSYTRLLGKFSFEDDKFSLKPEGTLELQQLANTFNELYFSFHNELQKRREAEKTMRAAKEEAELANNAKSEFLASMSHEIRTPLNTIIGYQFLLNETYLAARQKEYCDKIGMVANNLLGLINGILDFSKIEAGKMLLENVEFDIVQAVQDIYGMVGVEAGRKGLELRLHLDEEIPQVLTGDVTRLKQVMLNLLSNAIKFTEKGTITISLSCKSSKLEDIGFVPVCISVEDTGIGISQEQLAVIFDHFTQGDASTTRKYGGTGLGLAICKRIAELMHGSIEVSSEPGKGSCFTFSAPLAVPDHWLRAEGEMERGPVRSSFINKRVLLVEDNEINLLMTKEILNGMGFETYLADSGQAAVKLAGKYEFDVILMDIRMPGIDGYETTRRIRQLEACRETPIIALTADAVDGVAERAQTAGMNGFLTKPLYPSKLAEILWEFVGSEDSGEEEPVVGCPESGDACTGDLSMEGYVSFAAGNSVFERGIAKLGGNRKRYAGILAIFVEGHRGDGEKILSLYRSKRSAELGETVHRLKGLTGSLGANELYERCKKLEDLLKAHAPKKQIINVMEYINSELLLLCKHAQSLIEAQASRQPDTSFVSEASFSDVIANLNNYVVIADSEAKDYFMENSSVIKANMDQTAFSQLKKAIMEFDFEQAELYLEGIAAG